MLKFLNMEIRIKNNSQNELPSYATPYSAGVDLRAAADMAVEPGGRILVPTNLFMEIPNGYELQIRPRSGLALKQGITVLNTPGTIDSDYRGNVGVILINTNPKDPDTDLTFMVNKGDRIAQAVLNKVERIEWKAVESLEESERGEGGFGHTGHQ